MLRFNEGKKSVFEYWGASYYRQSRQLVWSKNTKQQKFTMAINVVSMNIHLLSFSDNTLLSRRNSTTYTQVYFSKKVLDFLWKETRNEFELSRSFPPSQQRTWLFEAEEFPW